VKTFLTILWRLIKSLPLLLLTPFLMLAAICSMAIADLLHAIFGRARPPVNHRANNTAASVVIPN